MAYCAPSAVVPVICLSHVVDDVLRSRRAIIDAPCVGATGDWSAQAASTNASEATESLTGWERYIVLLSVRVVERLSVWRCADLDGEKIGTREYATQTFDDVGQSLRCVCGYVGCLASTGGGLRRETRFPRILDRTHTSFREGTLSDVGDGTTASPGPLSAAASRYRVEGVLGRGGMATVYAAED